MGMMGGPGPIRSSLTANPVTPGSEPFSLQNPQMLKATFGARGLREFFARSGSMVAYQGAALFDGQWEGWAGMWSHMFGDGEDLNLMKVSGSGTVFLAYQAQDIFIIDLDGRDGLTIDGDNVLAYDPGLSWDVVRIEGYVTMPGVRGYQIEFTGRGQVALCTTGAPLVMRVTPQNYYYADADAVVGWSTSLNVSMQAGVTSTNAWKPRGNTGEGWQMQFVGDGYVIVQPSELLPPYHAMLGGAEANAFGWGQRGFENREVGGMGNPQGPGRGMMGGMLGQAARDFWNS
jgi:uncharacterized protein (AIM24 family)